MLNLIPSLPQSAEDLFRLAAEKAAIPCTKMT